MKYVVIGESGGASRDEIMAVYPRHKVVVDAFVERGEVVGIGPFGDGGNGPEAVDLFSGVPIAVGAKQNTRLDLTKAVEHTLHAEVRRA